jgi:hypothetical protein
MNIPVFINSMRLGGHARGNKWWTLGNTITAVGAWAAKGAASQADSYINLANPGTSNLTTPNAPTWDTSDGWTFGGSPAHLRSTIQSYVTYTYVVRFTTSDTTPEITLCGVWNQAGQGISLTPVYYSSRHFFRMGNGGGSIGSVLTGNTMGLAGNNSFVNGANESTLTITVNPSANPVYIGSVNSSATPGASGTASNHFIGKIQAVAFYDFALSNGQMAALHTEMMAL